jgi:hypothetical protein
LLKALKIRGRKKGLTLAGENSEEEEQEVIIDLVFLPDHSWMYK